MLVLSDADLNGLLSPLQIIDAVELALRSQSAGEVNAPKRLHLHSEKLTFLVMPAMGKAMVATKLVAVAPDNPSLRHPVTNGIMLLNDGETGLPVAVLNATSLTAQRTGAVGALGVKYLSPPDISSVGIIGCGVQGAAQAIAVCAIRPIRQIFAVSRSQSALERFVATISQQVPSANVVPCTDARDLLAQTRLVIAATTSSIPVLPDEPQLLADKTFISIGSFKPSMQEFPDSVYRLAGQLALDSVHARTEVGDVINPISKGILEEGDVFPIAECVAGTRVVNVNRTTAYKCVGAAVFDLFVAQALYHAARLQGRGQELQI